MIEPTRQPITVPPRSYVIGEDILDSILIEQKNKIFRMIHNKQYDKALGAVIVLTELWNTFGYSYKAEEILKVMDSMKKANQTIK